MSAFVTAKRLSPSSGSFDYVLMDGEQCVANLGQYPTVEKAYQFWLKESKKEFDWRSAGYLKVNWSLDDDWDSGLQELKFQRYKKDKQHAQGMVTLLERHRNAGFVEAEWQIENRLKKERQAAEAVKSVYKAGGDMKVKLDRPERDEAKKIARRAALFNEINELIGLDGVKHDVKTMVNHIKIQQARKASGLKTTDPSFHMVFSGNPGTGKTTIARLLAAIYREIGVLSKGHLVETDRSGLVAGYLGQTALKVREVVNKALGGVLFIDEAYALTSEDRDDYGAEAIATLLKLMEDNRDNLVVIAAGYPQEMQKFLEANPGLQSRFNKYLTFEDYTAEELAAIFRRFCSEADYDLSDDAEAAALDRFRSACGAKDSRFGNGRLARNCFEHAINNQSNRVVLQGRTDKESLRQLRAEDMPSVESLMPILHRHSI
jgi:stage V sporulation protein K